MGLGYRPEPQRKGRVVNPGPKPSPRPSPHQALGVADADIAKLVVDRIYAIEARRARAKAMAKATDTARVRIRPGASQGARLHERCVQLAAAVGEGEGGRQRRSHDFQEAHPLLFGHDVATVVGVKRSVRLRSGERFLTGQRRPLLRAERRVGPRRLDLLGRGGVVRLHSLPIPYLPLLLLWHRARDGSTSVVSARRPKRKPGEVNCM